MFEYYGPNTGENWLNNEYIEIVAEEYVFNSTSQIGIRRPL